MITAAADRLRSGACRSFQFWASEGCFESRPASDTCVGRRARGGGLHPKAASAGERASGSRGCRGGDSVRPDTDGCRCRRGVLRACRCAALRLDDVARLDELVEQRAVVAQRGAKCLCVCIAHLVGDRRRHHGPRAHARGTACVHCDPGLQARRRQLSFGNGRAGMLKRYFTREMCRR